jgi:serine/threonine protein kinase
LPPTLPEVIGKYKVERYIESGGMGDVYLARDPTLDRPVAIKFLREGFDSDEMRERFEREARAAGRLSHPNIVTIYEFGEFLRRPYIAMEFVRGEPLSKIVKRREAIPLVRKLEMMEGLCSGLGHAHKVGMVHRDIKPANLMVDADGPLKILDFGIVRMAGSGLTFSGVLVGTVNYMSPEQIAGSSAIDHRSDVFAVGSVLYEIFTYQRAFPGEMADVLYKIVHTQPQSAATLAPGIDPGIVRAIEQCLEKTPERRYQDLGVLRRDLARIRQRYEVEEQETHTHTAATVRPVTGTPSSHPGVPSGPGSSPSAERLRKAEESDRIARERAAQAERDRIAREQAALAERERIAREQAEKAERDRIAQEHEQAERARIAREQADKAERERIAREQAD